MKTRYLIIGAGPTGLGAAYRLKDLGESDFIIVDQNDWIGGLAASFVDPNGFTWDIGGHVQFSHYKYFDDAMDAALGKDGWLMHERESWVWMKERFVPYPFQNNIRYLPKEDVWSCLKGLIELQSNAKNKPGNFKEWILSIFGQGIADLFMLPYNYKVWAFPPEEMDYQWIGERVSVIDLKRITENVVMQKDDLSWGPNNLFRFPKFGGTGAIWRSIGQMIGPDKIQLNSKVSKINLSARRAQLENGDSITYDKVISTMPLNLLLNVIEGAAETLKRESSAMKYSSSHIIGVGLLGEPKKDLSTKCWMYFPESNCPFYRVTLFSKYSPNNVPDITKHFSLMTETSESPQKKVRAESIIAETIDGLLNTGLIHSRDQVCSTWHYVAKYGYPTPFLNRDGLLRKVIPELEKLGVFSRGRFGAWRYEVSNQDHSFMQGVEWVNRITAGEAEQTIWGTH
ncbi:MAG: FAD-dependent oxidoreductase [Deltaproteobacteria bacterium]|nr:FAD-dependent oxidoreductase [Deltaproteobacteria bacterium]